jgi:hypothetical protein
MPISDRQKALNFLKGLEKHPSVKEFLPQKEFESGPRKRN